MDDRYDLIAIGGGFAGLSAALRASEFGLRVAVLEAGRGPSYPANSRFANGILHLCYQDVTQGEEALRALLTGWTRGEAPADLIDALANDAARVLPWLRAQGVEIVPASTNVGKWYLAPPRPLVTHLDWRGWGPDRALARMKERLEDHGGAFLAGHRARKLVIEANRCRGVTCETDCGVIEIASNAVVICDGGFSADPRMFRRHIGPNPEKVLLRGAGTAVGDGARMAEEAGAALVRLDRFYGHLLCREAMADVRLWPYPQLDVVACCGVVVGTDGKRLLDEGLGGIHAANEIARLDDPLTTFAVFGEEIWRGPGRTGGLIPPNPILARLDAEIHVADTLAGLAEAAGIDAEILERTVAEHNRAVEERDLSRLRPPRSSLRVEPLRIDPPFRAIALCSAITFTMGGIAINGNAQALTAQGRPIDGLYAAGNSIGGLEGGPRADYVGGLMKAFVFGLRAGEHAAWLPTRRGGGGTAP